MSWLQTTFVVNADQVDRLSDMLESFLAQAVTSENAGEDECYEVAFPGTPDWQKVQVTGLFDAAVELAPIIDFVQSHFSSTSSDEIPVKTSKLDDQDWQRVWLSSFKPIKVGSNLWVCPSWCEPSDPNSRNIILDPGLAFGTGTHATTHMCLDWISKQNLSEQTVLDYGSGSGILAIAALLSGATHSDAVDIDPLAVSACKENAVRNNLAERIDSFLPDELSAAPTKLYNLVIANILADVIIDIRDTLLLHLRADGVLLLTGILSTQTERVIDAFSSSFSFKQYRKDHWCLLVGKRESSRQ